MLTTPGFPDYEAFAYLILGALRPIQPMSVRYDIVHWPIIGLIGVTLGPIDYIVIGSLIFFLRDNNVCIKF